MSDGVWARAKTNTLHYWQERTDHAWETMCGAYARPARPMEGAGPHCKTCERSKRPPPNYEDDLYQQIVDAGLPLPVRNYKPPFLAGMEYDLYWPGWLAVEVNGKIWRRGSHTQGYGLLRDYRKLVLSARAGVTLIMVPPEWIKSKEAIEHIRFLLKRGE